MPNARPDLAGGVIGPPAFKAIEDRAVAEPVLPEKAAAGDRERGRGCLG